MRAMAAGVATAVVEQAYLLLVDAGEQIDINRVERRYRFDAISVPQKGRSRCHISWFGGWRGKAFERIGDPAQHFLVVRIWHDQPASSALSSS